MDSQQKINMLDAYIYDYMIKNNLHESAQAFLDEAQLSVEPVGLNPPGGFLAEWWGIFWDIYSAHTNRGTQPPGEPMIPPPMMPLPDMEGGWQDVAAGVLEQGFNPGMAASGHILGYNAMPGEIENAMAAATTQTPEKFNIVADMVGSSSSIGYQLMSANNYWLSAAMEGNSGMSWMASNSGGLPSFAHIASEVPPLAPLTAEVSPLAPSLGEVPPPAPLPAEVPHAPQLPPDNPERNETGLHSRRPPRPPSADSDAKGKAKTAAPVPVKNGRGLPFWIYDAAKEKHLQIGKSAEEIQSTAQGEKLENYYTTKKTKTSENSATEMQKSQDVKVESFLPNQAVGRGTSNNISSPLQRSLSAQNISQHGFQQIRSLHFVKSKLTCCDISTPGKFLVAGGYEKVFIWNLQQSSKDMTQGHAQPVTDARFRPNSYIFATSSFDKSIRIWDADSAKLIREIQHTEPVMSLDFHPTNTNLLCSCDRNDLIKFWDVKEAVSYHTLKGGSKQVRFQPQIGKLLAAATGHVINLFDLDTGMIHCSLQGHAKEIHSITWDVHGQHLLSVSEESARIWSIESGGKCIHQLQSSGRKFKSCTFHPAYDQVAVLGSYQTVEIWSPAMGSTTMSIPAVHEGTVCALASAPDQNIVASVGQDESVKLWR